MRRFAPLFIILFPLLAQAGTLTLQDAVAEGLRNSFDIQSEKMKKSVSAEYLTQYQAKFDPVAAASVDAHGANTPTDYAPYNMNYLKDKTYEGTATLTKLHQNGMTGQFALKTMKTDTNNPYDALDPIYKTVFEMNITQPLLKNYGKDVNLSDVKKAELDMKEAQYDLYWKMINKAADIETAYYNVSRARDIVALSRQAEELADSLLQSDKKRFAAGMIAITEVQEAETAKAARHEQTVYAEKDLETAINNLENLTAPEDDMTDVSTDPLRKDFKSFSVDSEYKNALLLRPDLEKQRTELQKRDITIKYLKNSEMPELDLISTLGVIGFSGNARTTSHFDGSYQDSLTDMADANGFEWRFGLNFSVPLGQRAAKAKTAAEQGEKARAVYDLKHMERNARTDVKNAATVISGGQERYEVAQTFISLAQTTLDQEMKKMKEGMSDTFHILKFQEDLTDAKKRAVNALYDYNRGTAMLGRAAGTNLDSLGFKIGE